MVTCNLLRRTGALCLGVLLLVGCDQKSEPEEVPQVAADPKAELVAFVTKAAGVLEAEGDAAFEKFRQAGSEWSQGEKYLFVIDMEGTALFHGGNPALEGTSLTEVQDPDGISPTAEMLAVLEEGDSGWISYKWPKPGETEPLAKSSFVMKTMLGDKVVAIGSGIYMQ